MVKDRSHQSKLVEVRKEAMTGPLAVVVMCGKRKSGKDYVASQLQLMLGEELVCPVRLSAPLKTQYAKDHGLELDRLLDSSAYKESYRQDMVEWSETVRARDPSYFCRQAVSEATPNKVWLIVDARRKTDMQFFKDGDPSSDCHDNHTGRPWKVLTVRVVASDDVRSRRGWKFMAGVDDATSECGLDQYSCDVTVDNNSEDPGLLEHKLQPICQWAKDIMRNKSSDT